MRIRVCSILLAFTLALGLCLPTAAAERLPVAPSGLLLLEDGSLLIADLYQRALWTQAPGQAPVRLAGREGVLDGSGQPVSGYIDGTSAASAFAIPWAVASYRDGWAVTDSENHAVRYVADGQVYTLAGTGSAGYADGAGKAAAFSLPTGLAAGDDGCLYVADTGNNLIRKIDADGHVTTWAGGSAGRADGPLGEARFLEPTGLFFADGTLYVCDSGNNRLCKIENETVTTIAGAPDGVEGYRDGGALTAQFAYPQGIAVSGDSVYVADTGNGAVRLLQDGAVSTLCKPGSRAGGLYPVSPRALAVSGETLWVGDVFAQTIFSLELTQAAAPFYTDVAQDAWYADAVGQISRKGLMSGTGEGRFSPDAPLTRAMFITLLARLHTGIFPADLIGGDTVFSDVAPGAWYEAPAAWAAAQGLLQGDGGLFHPDRALTRAELVVLLSRYSAHLGVTAEAESDLSAYSDADQIPQWSRDAFSWAGGQGLLAQDDMLEPTRPATRAETAVLLLRYLARAPL